VPENPVQNVTFPSNGTTAHGYLAVPESGSGPGVIVIQEWWGLTDHIAQLTDRFAADGFVALAPDLYGGATAHDATEARALMERMPADGAARDLAGALEFLLDHASVTSTTAGVVGFCMGGAFVLLLAAQQGDRVGAAVPFYGLPGPETDFSGLTAPVLGHYGEQDTSVPLDAVHAVAARIEEQSGVRPDIRVYPAGHAFVNDAGANHDPGSAALAWDRTVEFLRARLS
jgi:carboxymethylenebutenolidase